jgi:hypothetical protein
MTPTQRPLPAAAALLLLLAGACAGLGEAFAPAQRPWPVPKDGRVRRDGRLLRVYGASLKSRDEAEKDARRLLEGWLWRLELGEDIGERRTIVERVLASPEAKPVPSPVPEVSGFTSLIELDLPTLQKKLGTHYD